MKNKSKKQAIEKAEEVKPIPYENINWEMVDRMEVSMDNILIKLTWKTERMTNMTPAENEIIGQEVISVGPDINEYAKGDKVQLANPYNFTPMFKDGFCDIINVKRFNIVAKIK